MVDRFSFIDDEDETTFTSPSNQTTSSLGRFGLVDDEEDETVEDDTSSAVTSVAASSTPTVSYIPEGYEYKETPTFDDRGDPIVKKELVEIGVEPAPKPPEPDFTFEETSAAFSQAGRDLLDTLTLYDNELHNVFGEEFTVTQVPEYLRPFVRITGKTVDGLLVKPFTEVIPGTAEDLTRTAMSGGKAGLMFLKETAEGFGSAITRAVRDNITSESDAINTIKSMPGLPTTAITLGLVQEAAKAAGVEGKDIFPFTPKTGGEMFARDLAMMAEVEAGLPITTAVRTAKGINAPLDETVGAANRHAQRREELASRRIRLD